MKRVAAGLLALGLVACAPSAGAKTVNITYWGMWSGVAGKAEQENVAKFNKLYQGKIFVKAVAMDDPQAKTLTAIAGGVSPDCFKLDRFKTGSWAARDLLVCLDPFVKKDKFDPAVFYKPTWGETIYGGRSYALPFGTDSRALFFNKTMFSQVGLDVAHPPKTWEDLTLVSKKLDATDANGKYVRGGLNPLAGNWWYCGWLFSAGGDITTANGRKANWNTPEGLKALRYIDDMIKKYGGMTRLGAIGDIWGGRMAMELNGSWNIGNWKATKNKKFELGVAPPPRPMGLEGEWKSWAGGFALCLPRGSKHQKEAWEFMKWVCASKAPALAFGVATGGIPALNTAARDQKFQEMDPLIEVFTDILPDATFRTVLPCGEEAWALYADTATSVGSMIQAQKKSPEDILMITQLQAQKVFDRAWARVRRL